MLNLRDYTWNVYEICQNNPEASDIGVAFDMLRNNIKWGKEIDKGTDLDWAALKVEWDAMTAEEQSQSRKDYHVTDQLVGMADAFKNGDKEKFKAIQQAEMDRLAALAAEEAEAADEADG